LADRTLSAYGWTGSIEAQFEPYDELGLQPALVLKQDRGLYTLFSRGDELPAEVSGRFRHEALWPADFPAVGDWVAMRTVAGGPAVIDAVLPRRSSFIRKAAGTAIEAQVVAANIDTVFLVSGLDGDFNLRRIERYVTTAWSSGAEPVIVLNKADLRADLEAAVRAAEAVAPGVPVLVVAARGSQGLDALTPYLRPGKTVALLGSSGVGKSTIINRLLGEDRFRTGEVSDAAAGRGRHTTSSRELVRLAGGALLIDTPGLRELGLWADDEGLDRTFSEIECLAIRCRFPDCSHENEPGCAVRQAVQAGFVAAERWENYRKLKSELRALELRKDEKSRRQHEKAAGRDFAARLREVKKNKPRYR